MIDIHCHLLEKVDDGSKDSETTNKMIEIAKEDGINSVIATPHYCTGYYENSYDKVVHIVNLKNKELKSNGSKIRLFPGQEIYVDRHTLDLYKKGIIRGLNDTKYLLLEFDLMNYEKKYLDIIYELRLMGIVPIIAHPERYTYIVNDNTKINDFIKEGCLFQINSSSIAGLFGSKVQKTSKNLIRHGVCNFIASDAHSAGGRAPKVKDSMKKAVKINKDLNKDIKLNPKRLINNEPIKQCACNIKKKRGFFI